jgi:hypothetical protein
LANLLAVSYCLVRQDENGVILVRPTDSQYHSGFIEADLPYQKPVWTPRLTEQHWNITERQLDVHFNAASKAIFSGIIKCRTVRAVHRQTLVNRWHCSTHRTVSGESSNIRTSIISCSMPDIKILALHRRSSYLDGNNDVCNLIPGSALRDGLE